ncbi:MAG: GNAT family N-acetyltransferase [Myxococcales bacterium]|nr:GNAT family N-acetyltransferase [Myxococcales bacterium]
MLLTTARLVASRPTREHLSDLEALFADERVNWDFRAYGIPPISAETFLERCDARFEATGHAHSVLHKKDDGAFVGLTGLAYQEIEGEALLEVGYRLAFEHWKKGYATEAALAFREHAFREVGVSKLIALIRPDNVTSLAVAGRLGMRFQKMVPWKMVPEPIGLHAITRDEWLALRQGSSPR